MHNYKLEKNKLILSCSSKAQLSTMDGMFGLIGLTFVLIFGMYLFSFFYIEIPKEIEENEMKTTAFYAFEQLLSSGNPANWQYLNLSAINNFGVESENSILDETKMLALNSTITTNYSFVKERMGIPKYNFSVRISDYYTQAILYSIGNTSTNNVISTQRISMLNNSLVLVQFKVTK